MISISLSLCNLVISRFFYANSPFPRSSYGDIARSQAASRLERKGGDIGKPRSWRGLRKSRRHFFADRRARNRSMPKGLRRIGGPEFGEIAAVAWCGTVARKRSGPSYGIGAAASTANGRAGEGRSCQPAESGHSVLPLIVIAGKASNNGEARQGGRHDHEHWQAARSALEDGDRFRSGGLGSGARPGLRRRPDHRRADHERPTPIPSSRK